MDKIRIAYVQPDCIDNYTTDEWQAMSLDEIAKEEGVELYTAKDFQSAFNDEFISDLGYIFFYKLQ